MDSLWYALVPVAALWLGGLLALVQPPGERVQSAILHFAAGVIFAVVGCELLPEILRDDRPRAVLVGFGAGIALMLVLRWLARRAEPGGDGTASATPLGLLAGVGVDLLIDGVLLGIGFAAGAAVGVMLAIALATELLALGVATTTALGPERPLRALGVLACLGALFWTAAVAGEIRLSGLDAGDLSALLAFGVAALLFLVTEELLVEAHGKEETPLLTATFFAGFLAMLVLGMDGGG